MNIDWVTLEIRDLDLRSPNSEYVHIDWDLKVVDMDKIE